jgi:hypothetical protein
MRVHDASKLHAHTCTSTHAHTDISNQQNVRSLSARVRAGVCGARASHADSESAGGVGSGRVARRAPGSRSDSAGLIKVGVERSRSRGVTFSRVHSAASP